MVCLQTQNGRYGTCAYHSLTFVDFATRINESDVFKMIMKFRRHMRRRPDVQALLTVEKIIKECGGGVNISMWGWPANSSALLVDEDMEVWGWGSCVARHAVENCLKIGYSGSERGNFLCISGCGCEGFAG